MQFTRRKVLQIGFSLGAISMTVKPGETLAQQIEELPTASLGLLDSHEHELYPAIATGYTRLGILNVPGYACTWQAMSPWPKIHFLAAYIPGHRPWSKRVTPMRLFEGETLTVEFPIAFIN